ncbi:MAG: c-type cytochrome [Bryobacterales bacterium]|nr:c-type cytochrome [Bryobacterales bacterium]
MRIIAVAAGCLALASCQTGKENLRPAPARLAVYSDAARESQIQPGGALTEPNVTNPDYGSAFAISEGQRLFDWYNCSGCHAHGGGGIGPPLIKTQWIYGGEPANIFDTIVKGRPNGMPSWGGRIPQYQIWELVAFVRSLNHEEPTASTAPRGDNIEINPANITNKAQGETK